MTDRLETSLWDSLTVFHGELTPARAQIFARLDRAAVPADCSLVGEISGPFRAESETLPIRAKLHDRGPGSTLLAGGLVVDPSYWSPEAPNEYRVRVELRHGGATIAHCDRRLGLRAIAAQGRGFFRENKPWIPRGVCLHPKDLPGLSNPRSLGAVLVLTDCDQDALRVAERQGAYVLVELPAGGDALAMARTAAQSPAVFAVVGSADAPLAEITRAAPNLTLLQRAENPDEVSASAHGVIADLDDPRDFALRWNDFDRLVLVRSPQGRLSDTSLTERRLACDGLQRALAPWGQFAGYLVGQRQYGDPHQPEA